MKRVIRIGSKRKAKPPRQDKALAGELKTKVALIPIELEAVAEELEREGERLTGPKHSRKGGLEETLPLHRV